jgi:hypothetical protein
MAAASGIFSSLSPRQKWLSIGTAGIALTAAVALLVSKHRTASKLRGSAAASPVPSIISTIPAQPLAARSYVSAISPLAATKPGQHKTSIMQWNGLADWLTSEESFPNAIPAALPWSTRAPLLLQQITAVQPDICALEECDHFEDWFMPQLAKHGYQGIFMKKVTKQHTNQFLTRRYRFRSLSSIQ